MYEITNYDWYKYPLTKGGEKNNYIYILVGEVDLTLKEAGSHRDFSIQNFRLPSDLLPIYALMYGVPLSNPMVAGCHFNDTLDIIRFNCDVNNSPYYMAVSIKDPTGSYTLAETIHYWQPSLPSAGSFNAIGIYFPVIHTKDDYYINFVGNNMGNFWDIELIKTSMSFMEQYTSKVKTLK